jgi:hypothetical protein
LLRERSLASSCSGQLCQFFMASRRRGYIVCDYTSHICSRNAPRLFY